MRQNNNFELVNLNNLSLFEFNRIIEAWNLNFIQLRSGKFSAKLSQIIYPDFQLGYAKFNTAVKQEGLSPEGVWTFAFVNDIKIHWRNYRVEPNSIIIYAPGSEINAVSEANFEVMTFSISEQYLFEIAKQEGVGSFIESLKTIEILVSKDSLWSELRSTIFDEINKQLQNPINKNDESFKESFTIKLFALLRNATVSTNKVSGKKRLNLLHNAEQYILQNITEPNTVSTIASSLKVSERTLLYAFRNRFDMGSKAYMLVLKLNHAHHRLHQENNTRSISSIVRDSGFWHMGQFYKDYKKFFGELPSKTLNPNK